MKKLFITSLICILFNVSFSQEKGDSLFKPEVLHQINFITSEVNIYSNLLNEAATLPRPYHMVQMDFDGQLIDSVAIRAKGGASAWDPLQVPIKVDFNEFSLDQSFNEIKKFNLGNSYLDESAQRDRMAYELFRRAGIASPKTAYAEVYVNGQFKFIYLLVQQIDKVFIKENFADLGSLNKEGEELIYGPDVFVDIMSIPGSDRIQTMDTLHFLKFLAVNHIVEAYDNYPSKNFYIHHSEKSNLNHTLPWDYNFCFYDGVGFAPNLIPYEEIEVWNNPTLKSMYLDIICELESYLLNDTFIMNLITDNANIISSNSNGITAGSYASLLSYIQNRKQWISEQLLIEGYSCDSFSCPIQKGDIVINEFVAAPSDINGNQDPNNETSDWIELFNNTSNPISLDHHYYLSDDKDFLKKWNFKTSVTIPANGYQIIWADRDIEQVGIHSNFKINKSLGDLLFVHEDLTIIDSVSYNQQSTDLAFARVPNGTGSFVTQTPAFSSDNETVGLITHDFDFDVKLYPNPASDVINIYSEKTIDEIRIINLFGKTVLEQKKFTSAIDIKNLSEGIYLIEVVGYGRKSTTKFIKFN